MAGFITSREKELFHLAARRRTRHFSGIQAMIPTQIQGEDAYWMLRTKSLIQANLGDYKGAVETANKGLKAAEKAKSQANIDMNKASIAEWSKKIK